MIESSDDDEESDGTDDFREPAPSQRPRPQVRTVTIMPHFFPGRNFSRIKYTEAHVGSHCLKGVAGRGFHSRGMFRMGTCIMLSRYNKALKIFLSHGCCLVM